jgi:flagellar FliL protein
MAKKKAEGDEEKGKKGKSNLLPAVIVAVGLVGAGFMLKGGSSPKAAAAGAGASAVTTTTVAGQLPVSPKSLEQIAQLSDVTLNLSDGHYLKLGLALQLAPKATVTDYTSGGAAAKALDLAINDLGTDNYNELLQPSFRAQAKVQLQQQIVAAYQGQVLGIYFTDFIMQ